MSIGWTGHVARVQFCASFIVRGHQDALLFKLLIQTVLLRYRGQILAVQPDLIFIEVLMEERILF